MSCTSNTTSHRIRRLAVAGVALLALVAQPARADGAAQVPAVHLPAHGVYFPDTFTLANGLQVVVISNHRVPVVTQMVWYKVGAAEDQPGKSGMAHFLEHLMFKGTPSVGPGEFNRLVAENGGRDNAFTSWDYTSYFQTVASDRLELVMRLESDRMANLTLTDALVDPERDVVTEEKRQRSQNRPADRLTDPVNATLHVAHPYGRPILGWDSELRGLTRADAEAFYRTWYAPNNAILVVSGDIDADALRPLAERYYGAIPARPVPARVRPEQPRLGAERRVVLRDGEVRQPMFERLYLAPSYRHGRTEDAWPLQVLAEIMGGSASSRLHRALVVDRRIASSVDFSYSPDEIDLGTMAITASPLPGADIGALEAAVSDQLAHLVKDGVNADEVATAKRRLLAESAFARDSLQGPAYVLGAALATGRTIDDVESWPERIDRVTADQVTAAARRVLDQPDAVTGLLLPAVPEGGPKP